MVLAAISRSLGFEVWQLSTLVLLLPCNKTIIKQVMHTVLTLLNRKLIKN